MPVTYQWVAPEAIQSTLTTELNSLASATKCAPSTAIDNESGLYEYVNLELVATYGVAPSTGGYVAVYALPSVDGTNYADGDASTVPQAALLLGYFALRAVTTAQRVALTRIPLPPCKFKLLVDNQAGQAMAASGNTLKYRRFNEQSVG